MKLSFALACFLACAAACGGSVTPLTAGTSPPAAGPGADGGSSEAGDDDAATCVPRPPDVLSRGSVKFVFTNRASSDRFVLVSGWPCVPFTIEGVRTAPPDWCECECDPVEVMHFVRVTPGASASLTWDGREALLVHARESCSGEPCRDLLRAVNRPVDPGSYTAQIAILDSPPGCDSWVRSYGDGGSDGDPGPPRSVFECQWDAPMNPSQPGDQCNPDPRGPSVTWATQTFDLPAGGDVTVAIDVQ
jgi:hypothetical protein